PSESLSLKMNRSRALGARNAPSSRPFGSDLAGRRGIVMHHAAIARCSRALTRFAVLPVLVMVGALAALPDQALAGIALVATGPLWTNGTTTTGTTLSITVPAGGVPVKNTVIVTFALDPAAGSVSCSDARSNVYTVDVDQTNGSATTGVRTVVCSSRLVTAL